MQISNIKTESIYLRYFIFDNFFKKVSFSRLRGFGSRIQINETFIFIKKMNRAKVILGVSTIPVLS